MFAVFAIAASGERVNSGFIEYSSQSAFEFQSFVPYVSYGATCSTTPRGA